MRTSTLLHAALPSPPSAHIPFHYRCLVVSMADDVDMVNATPHLPPASSNRPFVFGRSGSASNANADAVAPSYPSSSSQPSPVQEEPACPSHQNENGTASSVNPAEVVVAVMPNTPVNTFAPATTATPTLRLPHSRPPVLALSVPTPRLTRVPSMPKDIGRGLRSVIVSDVPANSNNAISSTSRNGGASGSSSGSSGIGNEEIRKPPRKRGMRTTASLTTTTVGLGFQGTHLEILDVRMDEDDDEASDDDRRRRTPYGSPSLASLVPTPTTPLSPISGLSDSDNSRNPSPVLAGGSSSTLASRSSSSSLSVSMSMGMNMSSSISSSGLQTATEPGSASIPASSSTTGSTVKPITPELDGDEYRTYYPSCSDASAMSSPTSEASYITSPENEHGPGKTVCYDADCATCVPHNLTVALLNAQEQNRALSAALLAAREEKSALLAELERERTLRKEAQEVAAQNIAKAERLHEHYTAQAHQFDQLRTMNEHMQNGYHSTLESFQDQWSQLQLQQDLRLPPLGENPSYRKKGIEKSTVPPRDQRTAGGIAMGFGHELDYRHKPRPLASGSTRRFASSAEADAYDAAVAASLQRPRQH